MTIRKAIIPAAGLGTRFLPATKAQPKEMLPVVDKPAIQYIVEEAVHSGIEQVVIVTGRNKQSIENHFDKNHELEYALRSSGKTELLQQVQNIAQPVDLYYVRQRESLGLGHAIWCARSFIGEEPFAVLLGDVIIDSETPCIRQLVDRYERYGSSIVAVEPVPWKDTSKYGVIDGVPAGSGDYRVRDLVEKPKQHPPSRLAITGRYVIEPQIFDILEHTRPGIGGEIQLTDALREMLKSRTIIAHPFQGKSHDIGSKIGYLKATVEFALARQDLEVDFRKYIRSLAASGKQKG